MKAQITVSNAASGRILATGVHEVADRSELPKAISAVMDRARQGSRFDEMMRTTTTVQKVESEAQCAL